MAIDFPNSPVTNQTYTVGDRKWVYDGEKWTVVPASPELLVVGSTAPTNTNVIWADTTVAGTMNSTVPSGGLMPFAGITAPLGWLLCFGQTVSRATYPDLFTVLGTLYNVGGEAGTDFRLPDLRGRTIAGQDDMGGTSANRLTGQSGGVDGDVMGGTGGLETHTLTSAQMPTHTHTQDAHTHTQNAHGHDLGPGQSFGMDFGGNPGGFTTLIAGVTRINQGSYQGPYSANANTATNQNTTATNQNTGGNGAHNNVQPTIILNYIIKT